MSLCGAPAAPRAVGRGGARERAQFSPQAETELSGLCDDDNGGRIPRGNGPLAGASLPGRLITAPTPLPEAFPASKEKPLLKGVNHTHHAG